MITRREARRSAVIWAAGLALVLATGALGQAEDPRNVSVPRVTAFEPGAAGINPQSAIAAYEAGQRELEHAAEMTAKLPELKGRKLASTEKKIAKAYASAQGSFRRALALDPSMIEAYLRLGEAYRATGMYTESYQAAVQGLRHEPTNDDLFAGWAESILGLDLVDDATKAYTKLLETNPERAKLMMRAITDWLAEHQADPGELDPGEVERIATWVSEQQKTG